MSDTEDEEKLAAQAVRVGADTIEVPEELLAEDAKVEKTLLLRVREMTVAERIKLALRGNREARMLLLRDPNRMVRRLVLDNPRIRDDEVIALARNRTADDELLRLVAASRAWTDNYQVRLALTTNPKTPIAAALRFLGGLLERDVRMLAKSKNVPAAISNQAKRMVLRRSGG